MLVKTLYAEDSHSLEEHRRWYTVDYRAVAQSGYGEFFF